MVSPLRLTEVENRPNHLPCVKGGILSEDIGGFLPLPKNIPISYPKLSYPLHGNDKVLVESNRLHVEKYYSYEIKL